MLGLLRSPERSRPHLGGRLCEQKNYLTRAVMDHILTSIPHSTFRRTPALPFEELLRQRFSHYKGGPMSCPSTQVYNNPMTLPTDESTNISKSATFVVTSTMPPSRQLTPQRPQPSSEDLKRRGFWTGNWVARTNIESDIFLDMDRYMPSGLSVVQINEWQDDVRNATDQTFLAVEKAFH